MSGIVYVVVNKKGFLQVLMELRVYREDRH